MSVMKIDKNCAGDKFDYFILVHFINCLKDFW